MPRTFERSIVNTFHLDQQVQTPQLSTKAIAEIAAMKKVIINCFENPYWDSRGTYEVANSFLQTFGGATFTAFLDVLFDRRNNMMIDSKDEDDYNIIRGFWGIFNSGRVVSETDLLRITEMLAWECIFSIIPFYEIIFCVNEFGTASLVSNLERAHDSLSLGVMALRELDETIMICRSRS
jgi:hypothetical protein